MDTIPHPPDSGQNDAPTCPECGNRVPSSTTRRRPGETFCTPGTCPAWRVVGRIERGGHVVPVDPA